MGAGHVWGHEWWPRHDRWYPALAAPPNQAALSYSVATSAAPTLSHASQGSELPPWEGATRPGQASGSSTWRRAQPGPSLPQRPPQLPPALPRQEWQGMQHGA